MKRLSDYKGEEALDILADIIEPLAVVFADDEIQKLAKDKKTAPIKYVKPALKNHKKEVLEILARIADMPVEEYAETVNAFTLPAAVLALINEPSFKSLFHSQSQTSITSLASSGSATENTEAGEN